MSLFKMILFVKFSGVRGVHTSVTLALPLNQSDPLEADNKQHKNKQGNLSCLVLKEVRFNHETINYENIKNPKGTHPSYMD